MSFISPIFSSCSSFLHLHHFFAPSFFFTNFSLLNFSFFLYYRIQRCIWFPGKPDVMKWVQFLTFLKHLRLTCSCLKPIKTVRVQSWDCWVQIRPTETITQGQRVQPEQWSRWRTVTCRGGKAEGKVHNKLCQGVLPRRPGKNSYCTFCAVLWFTLTLHDHENMITSTTESYNKQVFLAPQQWLSLCYNFQ